MKLFDKDNYHSGKRDWNFGVREDENSYFKLVNPMDVRIISIRDFRPMPTPLTRNGKSILRKDWISKSEAQW